MYNNVVAHLKKGGHFSQEHKLQFDENSYLRVKGKGCCDDKI